MVFTDGQENDKPYIRDMTDEVIRKEAIVHGLLLAGVADSHDLIKLSVQSGGDFCIYEDSGSGGIDYYQCMMNIVSGIGTFAALEVHIKAIRRSSEVIFLCLFTEYFIRMAPKHQKIMHKF